MSDSLRFALVALVAGASAALAAQAVILIGQPRPDLRAAKAEGSMPSIARAAHAADRGAVMKASDGHYWADGEVNGRSVRFLVDTGATTVALTPRDARRLGMDPARLTYGHTVVTAAGPARAAAVELESVSVAGARLEHVDALVIERGLDASLLGMTYLGRLSSFEATRHALFLQP